MYTYTVKSGESLASISHKFQTDISSLATQNDLKSTQSLSLGRTIDIPVKILRRNIDNHETRSSIAKSYQVAPDQLFSIQEGEHEHLVIIFS